MGEQATPAGDDCAIVTLGSERLAVSTDIVLEGTHFRPGWMSPAEIGWRAAAAALSDLAAIAAEPLGLLVSLGVSPEWPEEHVADVMEGIGEAGRAVGAMVWGGDLVRSEQLVVDVVVVGRADAPVLRSGAQAGDGLWVTGSLGAPAAALRAWLGGHEPDASARQRFAHPHPRIAEAKWLRDQGARAMIDISDGLVGDAGHLAAASAVAVAIDSERVPLHAAADSPDSALVSGEEYELLVALPEGADPDPTVFQDTFGIPLTRIGRVAAGAGVEVLKNGLPAPLPTGYVQF